MQTIKSFLKSENARIDYEDKWMVWDEGEWLVLQRLFGTRKNIVLYKGNSETDAIGALGREED